MLGDVVIQAQEIPGIRMEDVEIGAQIVKCFIVEPMVIPERDNDSEDGRAGIRRVVITVEIG